MKSERRKAVNMFYRVYFSSDGKQFFSPRKVIQHERILKERRQSQVTLETIKVKPDYGTYV